MLCRRWLIASRTASGVGGAQLAEPALDHGPFDRDPDGLAVDVDGELDRRGWAGCAG